MFPRLHWSFPLPHRPLHTLVIPDALIPLVDDCARRLARAPEKPGHPGGLADFGVRTLCGRFPG